MFTTSQLLRDHEVAELLGFHVQTLRNQRFAGTGIPYHKLGRAVRYALEDVQAYINEHRIVPGGEVDHG